MHPTRAFTRTGAALLAALALQAACVAPAPAEGSDLLAITDCTLIDGTGAAPRANTTILIRRGRIVRVVEAGSLRLGPGARTLPASGKWVLPGFVDTHAHLPSEERIVEEFQALLDHGITAARSPATDVEHGVEVRGRLQSGRLAGPTYRIAGGLIDGPGSPYEYSAIVTTPDEIRAEVRRQATAGVDFIKLYTLLPPDLVAAGIDEAHRHGLEVIGHLGRTSWLEALDLGIDALTHSGFLGMASSVVPRERRELFREFFMPNDWRKFDPGLFGAWAAAATDEGATRDLGRKLARAGTILDPTLALHEAIVRGDDPELYARLAPSDAKHRFEPRPYYEYWSASERAAARSVLPPLFEIVRILHEEGALLTAGTDVYNPWMFAGISFHRELELLAACGIPNEDVLVIATRNGAVALDLLEELGTVEVGKRADLVILSANPLEDIRNTERIDVVLQGGRRVAGNAAAGEWAR